MPTKENIPDKVYYKNDEFFGSDRMGMGNEFHCKWGKRASEFPTDPEEAGVVIDEDGIHGNKFYLETLDIASRILVALVRNTDSMTMSSAERETIVGEAVQLAKLLQHEVRGLEC